MENLPEIIEAGAYIVTGASALANLTKTKKDDKIIGFFDKILNFFAFNWKK